MHPSKWMFCSRSVLHLGKKINKYIYCSHYMALSDMMEYNNESIYPDNKIHGANMGSSLGRQDPGGPHVGPIPMDLAIWLALVLKLFRKYIRSCAICIISGHVWSWNPLSIGKQYHGYSYPVARNQDINRDGINLIRPEHFDFVFRSVMMAT